MVIRVVTVQGEEMMYRAGKMVETEEFADFAPEIRRTQSAVEGEPRSCCRTSYPVLSQTRRIHRMAYFPNTTGLF